MAAGKTLACTLVITLASALPALADRSGTENALWQYWQTRSGGEGVFANNIAVSTLATPVPAAAPAPAPITTMFAAPALRSAPVPAVYDVSLNFGSTFPDAGTLVQSGTAGIWSNSPSFTKFFGGQVPDVQAQANFKNDVTSRVQQIFQNSNLGNVSITDQPGVAARHILSVTSGGTFNGDNTILGMTYTGGNGFSYLDNFQHYLINDIDKLESAVAKNIAHELMHSFGGDHVHQAGVTVDAANTTWQNLVSNDPATDRFSPEASAKMAGLLNGSILPTTGLAAGEHVHDGDCGCDGYTINGRHAEGQTIQPVPEPSTFAVLLLPAIAYLVRRHRAGRKAA